MPILISEALPPSLLKDSTSPLLPSEPSARFLSFSQNSQDTSLPTTSSQELRSTVRATATLISLREDTQPDTSWIQFLLSTPSCLSTSQDTLLLLTVSLLPLSIMSALPPPLLVESWMSSPTAPLLELLVSMPFFPCSPSSQPLSLPSPQPKFKMPSMLTSAVESPLPKIWPCLLSAPQSTKASETVSPLISTVTTGSVAPT